MYSFFKMLKLRQIKPIPILWLAPDTDLLHIAATRCQRIDSDLSFDLRHFLVHIHNVSAKERGGEEMNI